VELIESRVVEIIFNSWPTTDWKNCRKKGDERRRNVIYVTKPTFKVLLYYVYICMCVYYDKNVVVWLYWFLGVQLITANGRPKRDRIYLLKLH